MNTGNHQRLTIDADRYSESNQHQQDNLFNYRQRSKYEISSLNDDRKNQLNSPNKSKKDPEIIEKVGKT